MILLSVRQQRKNMCVLLIEVFSSRVSWRLGVMSGLTITSIAFQPLISPRPNLVRGICQVPSSPCRSFHGWVSQRRGNVWNVPDLPEWGERHIIHYIWNSHPAHASSKPAKPPRQWRCGVCASVTNAKQKNLTSTTKL